MRLRCRSWCWSPLGLKQSGFFTDQLIGENISASHDVENDRAVVMPGAWAFPRSIDSTGGLISSASEQLAYARFHLGDGTGADGKPVLSQQSLEAMRANPGPGGTITMEIDGVCVGWWQRRTAEGGPGVPARRLMGRAELRLLLRTRPPIRNDRADQLHQRPQAPGRARPLGLGARQVLRVQQPAGRSQAAAGGATQGVRGTLQGMGASRPTARRTRSSSSTPSSKPSTAACGRPATWRPRSPSIATTMCWRPIRDGEAHAQRLPARAGRQGRVAARRRAAVGEAGVSRGSPPRPTRKLSTGKDLSAWAPPIGVSGPLSIVLKLM